MDFDQIFQTFLNRQGVHCTAAGKLHPFPERDLYSGIVYEFIVRGKPGLDLHIVVIFKQSLPHAVAHRAPAGIIIVRIQSCVSHLLAVAGSPVYKGFFLFRKRLNRQSSCQYRSRQHCRD